MKNNTIINNFNYMNNSNCSSWLRFEVSIAGFPVKIDTPGYLQIYPREYSKCMFIDLNSPAIFFEKMIY